MNVLITVFINPLKCEKILKSVEVTAGSGFQPLSEDLKYSSWIFKKEINCTTYSDAFNLERDIRNIKGVIDAEVLIDDPELEDAINLKYINYNDAIHEGRTNYPNPQWYKNAIYFNHAIHFAVESFKSGGGYFDISNSKINIALIDTGYTFHPEINKIRYKDGKNFIPNEDPLNPLDTLESTRPVPIRWGGHGTSCAGIMLGDQVSIPPSNQFPRKDVQYTDMINGLLPNNLNVIPYRVSRNIISFKSHMYHAIHDIIQKGNIRIVSMSHATLYSKKIYHAIVRDAYEKGILIVAAPGSHVFGSKKVFTYPARYPETIAPAASTINGFPWRLTHGGPEVDLCAPGFDMYIPFPFKWKRNGPIGYGYKWSEGSSFAVPIIATVAALWRMHHGDNLNSISPNNQIEIFRSLLKKTVTQFNGPVDNKIYGAGIVNVLKLLQHKLITPSKNFVKSKEISPQNFFESGPIELSYTRELNYLIMRHQMTDSYSPTEILDYVNDIGSKGLRTWLSNKYNKNPKRKSS